MSAEYRTVDACRICEGPLSEVLAYEPMPLANSYCSHEPHEDDYYPLTLMVCSQCGLIQIREEVPEEILYLRDYPYIPSTSQTLVRHFDDLAAKYAKAGQFVIDIGSSDGTLLKGFKNRGCKVLGIDPAGNLVEVAQKSGIPSIAGCFQDKLASWLNSTSFRNPDVVTATNVVANAHQMISFLKGVRRLLEKSDGLFVMETPNFLSLMKIGSYDSIYHEHMVYFTPSSLGKALSVAGLEMISLEETPIHGGSLRATAKVGKPGRCNRKNSWLPDFGKFIKRIKRVQRDLHQILSKASEEGLSVVGYTAPAKATVLLSQAGIKPSWMQYVVDNIPYKQGKQLPGLHIDIKPIEELNRHTAPYYILVHAWNFRKDILPKLQQYKDAGTKIVIPIPTLEVLHG